MEVFGFLIPIFPELLTIVMGLVIVYLVILELEFRQVRKIAGKFSDEETVLAREIKEFSQELTELRGYLSAMSGAGRRSIKLPPKQKAPAKSVAKADDSLESLLAQKGMSEAQAAELLKKALK